jgi:hypothetical protein
MFRDDFRLGRASSSRRMRSLAIAALVTMTFGTVHAQLPAPARPPKPAPAPAPAQSGPLPSARSILDKHVQAMGGREAIKSYSSSTAKGTLSMQGGVSGTIEISAARPNKAMVRLSIPGIGDVSEGFDGTHGWMLSPMTGPLLLEGKQLEDKRFDADFDGELRSADRYASMSTMERTEFDGRQCYKVRLVRKGGGEDIEFFDVTTGLRAGLIVTRESPMGSLTATTVTTEYKKFGKLLQPTVLKQQVAGQQQVITLTAVEYDNVPASTFDLPAGIKALVK